MDTMSDTTVNDNLGPAYVRYVTKVSPKQYETTEASVSIPVDPTNPDATISDHAIELIGYGLAAAKRLADAAVAGSPIGAADVQVDGARVASNVGLMAAAPEPAAAIEAAFPGAADVTPTPVSQVVPTAVIPPTAAPAGNLPKGSDGKWKKDGGTSNTAPVFCPKCGGPMWDNSTGKRNENGPDAKCKDKTCIDEKGLVTGYWIS